MNRNEIEQQIVHLLADFIIYSLAEELSQHGLVATAALRTSIALDDMIDRAKTEAKRLSDEEVKRVEVSNVACG